MDSIDYRVLVLPPTSKDAALTQSVLEHAGAPCICCRDMDGICRELEVGAGAVLVAEEAILEDLKGSLFKWLTTQPSWSDMPVLLLARPGADSSTVAQSMEHLGNVTVLERPTRVAALVSAVRTALRARQRQYQIRDQLAEREQNVVQLNQSAEALRKAQEQLQLVTDNMAVAVTHVSSSLRYLWVSPGCAAWLGRPAAEIVGKTIPEVLGDPAFETIRPHIERVLRGERVEFEQEVPYQELGRRWVRAVYVPTNDNAGQTDGWVAVIMDTTAHHKMEESLRQADRRKDEFLAMLAHELRNPLAPIRNSLHIMQMNRQHDPAGERVAEIMERQVNHLVRLVDDLLEVSRITRGKIELRKEAIEVASFVRSALETSRPLIDAAGHELVVSIPPEPLTVDGDPVRLAQVFTNLLNNAAKYMDAGGQIWLTVRRESGQVAISVRDTGTGISADMLPRVFDLFVQIDRDAERSQGGLGIGLTLAKSLVELHGGTVEAHSDGPGHGSVFITRLPLATVQCSGDVGIKHSKRSRVLTSKRVLVVDDNKDAAESLGTLLKLLGAEVEVAFSGFEALEALKNYQPAVMLLDIGMPGMDGYEVARRIRQQPEFQHATLVALTGWGQEEDRRRSETAGFDYHLIKPADLDALQTIFISLET